MSHQQHNAHGAQDPRYTTSCPNRDHDAERPLFLDYAASHPDAIITLNAIDMVLAGHIDASYLSESKARSRAVGHFFLSKNSSKLPNNGAVLTIAQIVKAVVSSVEEAKLGSLYIN